MPKYPNHSYFIISLFLDHFFAAAIAIIILACFYKQPKLRPLAEQRPMTPRRGRDSIEYRI